MSLFGGLVPSALPTIGLAIGWNFGGGGGGGDPIEVTAWAEPEVPTDEQLRLVINKATGTAGKRPIDQTGLQVGSDVE